MGKSEPIDSRALDFCVWHHPSKLWYLLLILVCEALARLKHRGISGQQNIFHG
jgi:hypothetical protein